MIEFLDPSRSGVLLSDFVAFLNFLCCLGRYVGDNLFDAAVRDELL